MRPDMTGTHRRSGAEPRQTARSAEQADWRSIALLACGVAAGPLFFTIFLTAGALRPGYDPLRHPVSSLEFGPQGWVQSVNFILTGTLVTLFGWGVRPLVHRLGGGRAVTVLLIAVGIGLVGAGFFDPDPLSGYPPGTPPTALNPSLHRILHDLFSTPVFTALPAACFVLARRFAKAHMRSWAIYSAVSGGLMAALFVLTSVAFNQGTALTAVGGLLQRLTLATGFAWMAVLGLWGIRSRNSSA
jgi:hypothetical protein